MIKITMETTKYEKKAGTKTSWLIKSGEKKTISEEEYKNIVDASPFFRRLGGSEYVKRSYTYKGYVITRILSTSPDKQLRTERIFTFDKE